MLNEVMISEKDPSQVSNYKLMVDDRELGKFKSSGCIIATGTGSSGWLYSAKQLAPESVALFRELIGFRQGSQRFKSSLLLDAL